MTPERWQRLKHVIESALEREPAARGAFLAEACGQDVILRAEAESFVATHEKDPSFLESPAWCGPVELPAIDRMGPVSFESGRPVGPYKIDRLIASGGMGAVYLAVRADDAYRKQVAIKVIRTDYCGDVRHREELLRRFRTERQTLANLDHPNIARLLDGGATGDGLPYLVMEYIEGQPIDRYCDDRRLSTSARLELFRRVCQAVNYAHRALVIHRDLKPGNILVTEGGEPKLLDFGLAKLLDSDSSALAATLTRTGLQPLTPAYASPEQIRGEPVTTSTDVYSLGVILYELLTGHRPYRGETTAVHDLARRICEVEPDKPSHVVMRIEESSDLEERSVLTPESASVTREGSSERLRRRLAGDVDTIVLKALRKEAAQRYASVEQLTEDIRRHLEGEPIAARPSTLAYRASKFAGRHKIAVPIAIVVVLSLAVGLVITRQMAVEAEKKRRVAEHLAGFWKGFYQPRDSDDFGQTTVDWSRRSKEKNITLDMLVSAGIERLPRMAEDPLTEAGLRESMATICTDLHRFEDSRSLHQQVLEIRRQELGTGDARTLESLANVGFTLMMSGKWQDARPILAEVVETGARLWGASDKRTLNSMMNLGVAESKMGESEKAESLFRQVLAEYRKNLGEDKELTLRVMNLLGKLLGERGNVQEGQAMLERTIEISKHNAERGPRHPATLETVNNLAAVFYKQNRLDEAANLFREVYEGCQSALAEDDPLTLTAGNNLAHCLMKLNRLQEAEAILEIVVSYADIALPKGDFDAALFHGNYGDCLTRLGRCDDAKAHLSQSYQALQKKVGLVHPATKKSVQRLVDFHEKCGSPEEARTYRAMLEPGKPASGNQGS